MGQPSLLPRKNSAMVSKRHCKNYTKGCKTQCHSIWQTTWHHHHSLYTRPINLLSSMWWRLGYNHDHCHSKVRQSLSGAAMYITCNMALAPAARQRICAPPKECLAMPRTGRPWTLRALCCAKRWSCFLSHAQLADWRKGGYKRKRYRGEGIIIKRLISLSLLVSWSFLLARATIIILQAPWLQFSLTHPLIYPRATRHKPLNGAKLVFTDGSKHGVVAIVTKEKNWTFLFQSSSPQVTELLTVTKAFQLFHHEPFNLLSDSKYVVQAVSILENVGHIVPNPLLPKP